MELRSAQQGAGMLRSADARDLGRELAPLHRPPSAPLNRYCSFPDALLMTHIRILSDSSVLWHASYSF